MAVVSSRVSSTKESRFRKRTTTILHEELFPRAFVPHAADADEAVTEIDPLEQRGEQLGRSGAASPAAPQKTETSTQPLVLCVQL